MTRLLRLLSAAVVLSAVACGDDAPDDKVTITLFQAAPDSIEVGQSTKLLFAVTPADAKVSITDVGDVSGKVQAAVTPAATTVYHLTATKGKNSATSDVTVTVGPQTPTAIKIEPASATPTAGDSLSVTLTAIVATGTTAPGYRGTVHLTSTDPQAVLPPDVVFAAADAGVKTVKVTLKTAGLAGITGNDVATPTRRGTANVTVQPAAASVFQLTALPATASAGQSLVLTITARDAFNNVATTYGGQAAFSSGDPTDILPATGAFTSGVRTVSVAFRKAGTHHATVSATAGTIAPVDTTNVDVGAASPFRIAVQATNATATAGTPEDFSATVLDFFDNVCVTYAGTVHFAATDPQADVPADFQFGAGDNGTHAFTTTLKTAGAETLALSDTVTAGLSGANSWNVAPAAAAACAQNQAPAATAAGSVVGVAVVLRDPFGNVATGYAGTIKLTASDARAVLPPDVTYVPATDAGSHAFSASLVTAGPQTLTATDTANGAIHCDAVITVTPGTARFVLAMPPNANAGFPVNVGITVTDAFNNAVPNYAGTVTFASSDTGAGAVTPAPVVFTGSEGGVGSASATFVTIGAQSISATDGGAPAATGSASSTIHGLVYTAPSSGRVRLVANAAQSNSRVVQLDLVANERLEVSTFFGGGPGSFAAGMNLPLDDTRAGPDASLFATGDALIVPQAAPNPPIPPVGAARIGSDHVLYTVVSRKRVAGQAVFTQETEVLPGKVFYSVRLRLTQNGTVGPVFDGAQLAPQLAPQYRASIRDQYGDDFVGVTDFGVGRLEIR